MRIYIIGFMGSGKSTFGKQLATYAGFSFLDLDQQFEKTHNTPILDFFQEHSEDEFREKETALLRQTNSLDRVVISLGGGTPCFHNNMYWLLENGLSIYLKLSPKALQYRLLHSKKKRPLIQEKTPTELLAYIHELLEVRETFYEQAHLTLSGINLKSTPINDTFRMIMNKEGSDK